MNLFFYLSAAVLFLIPLVLVPGWEDVYALPKATLLRAYLSFTLPYIIYGFAGSLRTKDYRKTALSFPVLFFIFAALLSLGFSVAPRLSFWGHYKFHFWGVLALLSYSALYIVSGQFLGPEAISRISGIMTHSSAVCAVIGMIQYFKGAGSGGRIFSTEGNPNFFGQLMMISVFISLSRFLSKKSRLQLFYIVLFSASILIAVSRSSMLGLAAGLFLFFIMDSKINKKFRIAAFFFLAAGFIILYSLQGVPGAAGRFSGRFFDGFRLKDANTISRLKGYGIILKVAMERPFLGSGPDTLTVSFRPKVTEEFERYSGGMTQQGYAHNELLQAFLTMGIFGLGAYIFMFFYFAYSAYRRFSVSGRQEYLALSALCAAFFISNLFSFGVLSSYAYVFFISGTVISAGKREKSPAAGGSSFLLLFPGVILFYFLAFRPVLAEYNFIRSAGAFSLSDGPEALRRMEKAVMNNPGESTYMINYAKIYETYASSSETYTEKEAYYHRAIKILEKQIKTNPYNALGYNAIGAVYLSISIAARSEGRPEFVRLMNKAVEYLLKGVEHDPRHTALHFNLARCYENLGQTQTALSYYLAVTEINPEDAHAHFNAGSLYGNLKNYDRARFHWTEALRIKPDYQRAKEFLRLLDGMDSYKMKK